MPDSFNEATGAEKLKLGLPKGSLEDATIRLFDAAGWRIRKHSRNYFPEVNDPELSISLARAQEIGGYVARGVLDAGITGLDWLAEGGDTDKVMRLAELVYSKNSFRPCRWVLAVAGDSPYCKPSDLAGRRIATELRNVTAQYFRGLGIPVEIFHSYGATEAKVVEGLADGIVEVTETGATIAAHGLRIIDEVMISCPAIIANPLAWQNPAKRAKLEQITLLVEGALRAQNLVALKMNAPAANLDAILAMLPALNSPTISPLRDPSWVSLETVVDSGLVRELIPSLRLAGAEGIIEYALNKVI
ncbi:MAG: ATP phosphoribosyltransferase [Desulfovibrio sp.]|nr:ATP phosphoribosyltransferase [Desulfovibrio sp.]